MTTVTPPPLPPDSGTQPAPHYCEHPADALAATGCPRWPSCATLDDDPEPDDEDEIPGLAVLLASLLGVIVGLALALAVIVLLLPVLL